MAITVINEDLLLPFTEETPVHAAFMNPIIDNVNKNTSAIGQIANDRGYVTTKRFTEASDLDNLLLNGFYESNLFLNTPYGLAGWFNVHVKNLNGGYCHQILTGMEGVAIGRVFERNRNNNVWSLWKEIATTDKILTFIPIPQPNLDANSIIVNGSVTTGSYCINIPTPPNLPASTEGRLEVVVYNSNYIVQNFESIYPTVGKQTRYLFNGIWSNWEGINLIPVIAEAMAGITIVSQKNYTVGKVMYVDIAVKRTDNGLFTMGTQWGLVSFNVLTVTRPKNLSFTCWTPSGFTTLVGSGGTGTLFTNKNVYVRTPIDCNTIHLMGSFLSE